MTPVNVNTASILVTVMCIISSASIVGSYLSPWMKVRPAGTHVVLHSSADDEARKLLEQAERIRQDISEFEKGKQDAIQAELDSEKKVKAEKRKTQERYSAEVPILKQNGQTVMERVDFPPRFPEGTSSIYAIVAKLPLGIILGEDEEMPGAIRVDEVVEGGNGDISGVQVGDLLRACTACQTTMETPTWQLLAGGIGQPKTKRFMYSTDGKRFEEVMDAVSSNRMDPNERPAVIVVERQ